MRIGAAELDQILGQLKDFQRNTVDYVFRRMYLDVVPARRFLVADEVGLGKTMVARGIIARTLHHLADRVRRIDVVYVCSNAVIAEQNVNRLKMPGWDLVAVATRLTMLPVLTEKLSRNRVNFVSFTPDTTFNLKSRGGRKDERAVLFRMLATQFPQNRTPLFNLLQCNAGPDSWRWTVDHSRETIDPQLSARFADQIRANPSLVARLEDGCRRFASSQTRPSWDDNELRYDLIGRLRHLLARVCVDALEPDLVILDEFQRFKDLLHGENESAELAQALLSYESSDGEAVRVLLLSATPYRMLSLNHEAADDHYADFLRTLEFLLEDDPAAVHETAAALQDHRTILYGMEDSLESRRDASRERAEALLRRVMVRTERVSFTHRQDAMVVEPPTAAPLEPRDLRQAVVIDRVAAAVGARDPIEYWKSAPYLVSFMKGYELKHRLQDLHDDPPKDLIAVLRRHRSDLLRWALFEGYHELDPANARLRRLMQDTVAAGQWELLWMPPSLPYLVPEGAYGRFSTTTKSLVFSSWNVVPDAIAALCSYEAERRMLGEGDHPDYAKLYEKRRPLLRFAAAADGRLTGMPALALLYPCVTLADAVDPLAIAVERGTPAPAREARELVRERLEGQLAATGRWPGRGDGPGDQRWYWASLALLDARVPSVRAWCASPGGWLSAGAGHETEATSRFGQHLTLFRSAFVGGVDLGTPPADLLDVLTEFALGSPAVCALRALRRQVGLPASHPALLQGAARVAGGFRTLFNLPETMGLLRGDEESAYWRLVLGHCVGGNLQAVLDEYAHVLREALGLVGQPEHRVVEEIAREIGDSLSLRTASLKVDEVRVARGSRRLQTREFHLRSRFALRFGDARSDEESALHRAGTVRKAFNSPFRPFILATTSIGQEGLDFHPWCHVVYHWNLPSNPVDLEQREGRVHRYKGHAIRKNVAERFGLAGLRGRIEPGDDPWRELFALAVDGRDGGVNDLVPFWIYEEGAARVERRVPLFPFSREHAQLARLKDRLAIYRLVFGQPRQEDLLTHLERRAAGGEIPADLARWGISLTPPRSDDQ